MKIEKQQIIQLLNRNIVANVTLMRFVQIACFVSSVGVLAFSAWNLTRLDLTAVQVIFRHTFVFHHITDFHRHRPPVASVAGTEGEETE